VKNIPDMLWKSIVIAVDKQIEHSEIPSCGRRCRSGMTVAKGISDVVDGPVAASVRPGA
jgi:hypothetical protein